MAGFAQSLASAVLEGLAGRFDQNRRILRLSSPLGDEALLAECMRGEEEISRGFRLEVDALSLDASIPLKSLLGQPVRLELLTAGSMDELRPFHGHVTAAELKGANGGFARYHLTIEPWTAFLALGRDSRIFQEQTVFDILDTVFQAYQGKGRLAPAWRFDILDRGIYPTRSITTQYQESDLAFAGRLMSEEGLFYFFEHEGDSASPSLGTHTLVVADHNGAFVANAQPDVRFTRPGAVMKEDSLDRWRTELRLQTNAIELASWDYRTCQVKEVSSVAQERETLTSRDAPGAYAFSTREQGQRIADNQLQALEARKEVHIGAGTVRTFAPGTTFTLQGHARYDGGDEANFTIVRVCHLAHNNLNADTDSALTRLLGQSPLKEANHADLASSLHSTGRGAGQRPVYRNRIDAIRSNVPYRASGTDGQGHLLHPRPLVRGQQTAIVVGPPGSVIHTDRDHRIKVQFHWQRGVASHSRLEHPAPDGHTGAPADDRAGIWIRVATPLAPVAGANWGSHALPRVGQEVLVDFFEGDIDRPVVIGAVYNGAGQADAQHNKVAQGPGASTGSAPMWFPGEGGAHAHPAVISGIKSQSLQTSQTGVGAYSQLVFDDSPKQARVALQRHAKPHQGTAELNLGHLRHQTDNQRLAPVGFGAELKTEHSTALRAGRGMLLTTDQASAGAGHLDSRQAASQIEQAAQLQSALASTAQKHNARLPGEGEPDTLQSVRDLQRSVEIINSSDGGTGSDGGAQGNVTAYAAPHLQLSTPAGIAAATPASAVFSAGTSTAIGAGQDINCASSGSWFQGAKSGISLFTYGKASNANKPGKETGIRLHAATGKVSSQSQDGATRLTADKMVTVASVTKTVSVGARDHVLLTAQGAYIELCGGNIELHGPGKVEFKATMKELTGPRSAVLATPSLPKVTPIVSAGKPVFSQQFDLSHIALNEQIAFSSKSLPYTIYDKSGKYLAQGVTDENGVTDRVFTNEPTEVVLLIGDGEWSVEEYFESDVLDDTALDDQEMS
jgi:type VI secretion system VgrG family protein